MSYLAFARHGLSQANIDKIVAGRLDTPLTEIGRQQARSAARLLRDITFHHIYGSPLQRTKETLEIMVEELGLAVVPSFHLELQERSWGDTEGTAYGSLGGGRYTSVEAEAWSTWSGKANGGESYEDMSARIVPFFDAQVLPKLMVDQNVLIVAHNGISKPLQRYLENLPREQTGTLNLKNCEVKLYEFDETGAVKSVQSRIAPGC